MRRAAAIAALILASVVPAFAQDATLDVPQATLNQVLHAVGTPASSGSFQPTSVMKGVAGIEICDELIGYLDCPAITPPSTRPGGSDRRIPLVRCRRSGGGFVMAPAGDPITWEWWIQNASFAIANGSMSVTATVKTRAGTVTTQTTSTVPASVRWNAANARLEVDVNTWQVPLTHQGDTITTIDVARYLEIAIPVPAQSMNVPLPNGATRTINGRILSASPQYQTGRIVVTLTLGF
jgi:hypothetical protein